MKSVSFCRLKDYLKFNLTEFEKEFKISNNLLFEQFEHLYVFFN